jgi:glutamine synthetase
LKATVRFIYLRNIEPFHNIIWTTLDTETGPGVYETALAYTSALRMADNAILYKYVAKSIGMKHGVMPSFMAKPWGNVSYLSLKELKI